MATDAAQSLIGGFNAGTNLSNVKFAHQDRQASQAQQQQQDLYQRLVSGFNETVKQMGQVTKNYETQLAQKDITPTDRARITEEMTQAQQPILASGRELVHAGIQNRIWSEQEGQAFFGGLGVAMKPKDPIAEAKVSAQAAGLEEGAKKEAGSGFQKTKTYEPQGGGTAITLQEWEKPPPGYVPAASRSVQSISTSTVPNIDEDPLFKALLGATGGEIGDLYKAAASSVDSISDDQEAASLLQQGILSGFGANVGLEFGKALEAAGLYEGDAIQRTEMFVKSRALSTLALLQTRALGSGTAVSDQDRKFLTNMTGQNIRLDENTLKRIVYLSEVSNRAAIIKYNNAIPDKFVLEYARRGYPSPIKQSPPMDPLFKKELFNRIKSGRSVGQWELDIMNSIEE